MGLKSELKRFRILKDINSIITASRYCGILPFFGGKDEDIHISKKGLIYEYVVCLVLVLTSSYCCYDILSNARDYKIMKLMHGDTEEINQTIEMLFCVLSYTVIIISCVYHNAKHFTTYQDMARIDSYLVAQGYNSKYRCPLLIVFLAGVVVTVLSVAFFYIHIMSNIRWQNQFILLGVYTLQLVISTVFALYVRLVLMNIQKRLEFINGKLEVFTRTDSKEEWRELSNLIEIFCKFRYVIENLNTVTGVSLLFYMGYAFYTVTNQSYLAFSTLTTHVVFRDKFDTMGLSVVWVLAEIIIMTVVCSSCDAMTSEALIAYIEPCTCNMCQGALVIKMPIQKVNGTPDNQRHQQQQQQEPQQLHQRHFNESFVRDPLKENPIFTDIKIILFVLKATGLLPIFERVSSYEVGPPNKPNEFYSFFVRGVVHAFTIFNLYNLFITGGSQLSYSYRDTDNINKWIEIMLSMLAYTATVFICARNAKALLQIFNEILKVDEEVQSQFSVTLDNKCGFSLRFLFMIFVCQVYLIVLKINSYDQALTPISYLMILFYAVQGGLSTTFIVFAATLLRVVKMRFAFLNLVLNGYSYVQQRKLKRQFRQVATTMIAFPEDSLFTFRMHNKLLRIYKSINECCSLILVAYMGYAFYTITTTTYNLFIQITTQRVISLNVLQFGFVWLCMHTSLLALLSRSCGEATKEANTTSQILARVYNKSKEYQNIIDKFLTKSIKQEVQFTAYGFFVIDNSTLFKIFSAVTTYLVILIQFKQLEDSKMEDPQS